MVAPTASVTSLVQDSYSQDGVIMGARRMSARPLLLRGLFLPFLYKLGTVVAMVNRMRHTRAHTANRRSHHALSGAQMSRCGNCGAQHRRHFSCPSCGEYRGKSVVNVALKAQKKADKLKREAGTTVPDAK